MCNYEVNRNTNKRKGVWFLSRVEGIFRGKILCTIGWNALHCEWKYINLEDSRVLTSGFVSSKKEVKVGYVKDSKRWQQQNQGTNLHPLIHLSTIRFKKTFLVTKKCVHNLRFRVFLDINLAMFIHWFKISFVKLDNSKHLILVEFNSINLKFNWNIFPFLKWGINLFLVSYMV